MPRSKFETVVATALIVLLAGIFLALGSAYEANAQASPEANQVEYWCETGGVKYEPVDDPFIVPAPPEGKVWTIGVTKGGTTNEVVQPIVEGQAISHSEHDNSHIILCWEDEVVVDTTTTSSTTSSTTTTAPTTTTTSTSTTTTTAPTTTTTAPATTTSSSTTTTTTENTVTTTSSSTSTTTSPATTTTVPPTTSTTVTTDTLPVTGTDLDAGFAVGFGLLLFGLSAVAVSATVRSHR